MTEAEDSLAELLDTTTADNRPIVYMQTYSDADQLSRLRFYCPVLAYGMNMPLNVGEENTRKNFEAQARHNSKALVIRAEREDKFTPEQIAISRTINSRETLEGYFEYRTASERESALILLKLPFY